jgi:hypothetical protein
VHWTSFKALFFMVVVVNLAAETVRPVMKRTVRKDSQEPSGLNCFSARPELLSE